MNTTNHDEQLARLVRQVRFLGGACVLLGAGLAGVIAMMATDSREMTLPNVIKAERLEILEPDGQRAFVLANSERPVRATVDGTVLLEDQRSERRHPTIIFFDGKGDEVGGMTFSNVETDDGFRATRHFALDGYKQDETLTLTHLQTREGASTALRIFDRPEDSIHEVLADLGLEAPVSRQEVEARIDELRVAGREEELRPLFGVNRIFLGSDTENEALLVLSDGQSRPRIEIGVPEDGEPYLRILDEDGETVAELPQ